MQLTHGKRAEGSRMAEWPVGAKKSGNADGAKGPCYAEFDSFDCKVRQGRDDKAFR